MSIVCLGWGSLVWKPGALPVRGTWQEDGPQLPLEFARVSSGGRVTLVIVNDGALCPSLWCELDVRSMDNAVVALAAREGCPIASIGRVPVAGKRHPQTESIADWCALKGFDGVVWTALQPGFRDTRNVTPSRDAIIAHLRALDESARFEATEYVAKAPRQIATRHRRALEAELGIVAA